MENLIEGPWQKYEDDLWYKQIANGQKIFTTEPPKYDSVALLSPGDIILSNEKQSHISAHNILNGTITSMSAAKKPGMIRVDMDIQDISLACILTHHSAQELKIVPGKDVWAIFKASSLHWQ